MTGARTGDLGELAWVKLQPVLEDQGSLLPIDLRALPFEPKRVFVICGVPPGTTRGGHAHRKGVQLLVRVSGQILVELRHDGGPDEVLLDDSTAGLLVPAGVWSSQTYLTADAALLVVASEPYDQDSYCDR